MSPRPEPGAQDRKTLSLWCSLYRYLWPFWLFQDVPRGGTLERDLAYQHNREQRVYLPGYIRKWSLITCALLLLTAQFGYPTSFTSRLLMVLSGLLTTGSFVLTVVFSAIYLMLESDMTS